MLSKIKKLFTDNRLKDLLSGNMVLSGEDYGEEELDATQELHAG
jgi:hypothetical protein